jgi:hypothetical protein
MKKTSLYLIAGLALTLPQVAFAQTADRVSVDYCNKLAETWSREHNYFEPVTADKVVAVSQCESNPRASIATLERVMTNAKMPLPPATQITEAKPR